MAINLAMHQAASHRGAATNFAVACKVTEVRAKLLAHTMLRNTFVWDWITQSGALGLHNWARKMGSWKSPRRVPTCGIPGARWQRPIPFVIGGPCSSKVLRQAALEKAKELANPAAGTRCHSEQQAAGIRSTAEGDSLHPGIRPAPARALLGSAFPRPPAAPPRIPSSIYCHCCCFCGSRPHDISFDADPDARTEPCSVGAARSGGQKHVGPASAYRVIIAPAGA